MLKGSWWWWIVGCIVGIVLIGVAIASVHYLVIMKRFETEIEIKDSHLYASRHNDD
jgi:hypothetical protein